MASGKRTQLLPGVPREEASSASARRGSTENRVTTPDQGKEEVEEHKQEDRFREILFKYDHALRRLASAYERDVDRQKDLVQEIRFAIWRALSNFRGQCSERTFIYRIAHNRALTHIAKRQPEQVDLSLALELPDISLDPEQSLMFRWRSDELRARIAALPLMLRQVVTLALEGLSNADIGEILGITAGNVAVRLFRAKNHLKGGGQDNE